MLKYWLSVPLIGITLILVACSESPNSSGGVLMSRSDGEGFNITDEPVGGGGLGTYQLWLPSVDSDCYPTGNRPAIRECARQWLHRFTSATRASKRSVNKITLALQVAPLSPRWQNGSVFKMLAGGHAGHAPVNPSLTRAILQTPPTP